MISGINNNNKIAARWSTTNSNVNNLLRPPLRGHDASSGQAIEGSRAKEISGQLRHTHHIHASLSMWSIMVTATEDHTRSSVHVKPLNIHKDLSRHTSDASRHTRDSSRGGSRPVTSSSHSQITPPATPNGSKEDLTEQINDVRPVFHNFLRAFYPFHPTYTISDTTVTLPLNEGDVILVHSIHTNGWADGTLLVSGARGWLPTNYCEAYDPEPMRNLLKALLNFWDLLRSGLTNDSEVFGNQEFMRGIIAGVRYLLVSPGYTMSQNMLTIG